ncbi:hypothetical protein B0J11DRAFT_619232 [Dendryphion nanum]|uniref:Uncharacterized protein n=1 Tax=Dendryphion nanum TaxID=256645 RepID=A0A9P9IAI2_9PLEO|nr:hypothetical protein B0J11DRAFT_619232 [Dendryphion nanum]
MPLVTETKDIPLSRQANLSFQNVGVTGEVPPMNESKSKFLNDLDAAQSVGLRNSFLDQKLDCASSVTTWFINASQAQLVSFNHDMVFDRSIQHICTIILQNQDPLLPEISRQSDTSIYQKELSYLSSTANYAPTVDIEAGVLVNQDVCVGAYRTNDIFEGITYEGRLNNCIGTFKTIVDRCDNSSTANKRGGSLTIGGLTFSIYAYNNKDLKPTPLNQREMYYSSRKCVDWHSSTFWLALKNGINPDRTFLLLVAGLAATTFAIPQQQFTSIIPFNPSSALNFGPGTTAAASHSSGITTATPTATTASSGSTTSVRSSSSSGTSSATSSSSRSTESPSTTSSASRTTGSAATSASQSAAQTSSTGAAYANYPEYYEMFEIREFEIHLIGHSDSENVEMLTPLFALLHGQIITGYTNWKPNKRTADKLVGLENG